MLADTPAGSGRPGRLLWSAFALSGIAGLVYELVWTRYLALLVGHSAYAQILVLVVYLGGTAVGSLLVAERSRSLPSPLLGYAAVEGCLGALGILFHFLYRAGSGLLYGVVVPAVGEGGATIATWLVASALILPQAVLLGTTFPLMAAGIVRHLPHLPGRSVANVYLLNTLGGAAGVLLGGFVFVPTLGMPATAMVAGTLNLAAAALAMRAGGAPSAETAEATGADASAADSSAATVAASAAARPVAAPHSVVRLLLVGTSISALASFLYEIGWIRMLSLLMGSATHSFELMLSAFLVGLGLGSLAIRDKADDENPLRLLGVVQWLMGLAALLTIPLYSQNFDVMAWLIAVLPKTDGGYALFNLSRYAIALIVMLPATALAGMTLPLFTGTLLRVGAGEGSIGRAYGMNTLGAMLGASLGGLVVLPRLGLEGLLALGGALDMAVGVALLAAAVPPRRRVAMGAGAAAAAAVLVIAITQLVQLDRTVLTSGVYRSGLLPDSIRPEMLFYRDAATATVAVQHYANNTTSISTNGKPDASLPQRWIDHAGGVSVTVQPITGSDESTQVLGPLILLAHNPGARRAGVIGHGSGMSGQLLLGSPRVDSLITIEIEYAMIQGARSFLPANRRPYEDPRSRFLLDDARSALASSTDRYDLIFSEPSNPWVSGVASLFTVQFYERVHDRLAPGGVFGQWFHTYEMEDALLLTVLAAVDRTFPDWNAWMVGTGDVLIVAGEGKLPEPDWSVTDYPGVRENLSLAPRLSGPSLETLYLFDARTMGPLLKRWPVNTDYEPILDEEAEKARFLKHVATGVLSFATESVNLQRLLTSRRLSPFPIDTLAVSGLPLMSGRAIAGWLATTASTDNAPSVIADGDRVRQRGREFAAHSALGVSQDDWGRWLSEFTEVEGYHHAGTAGWIDTTFYATVDGYLASVTPPDDVLASIALLKALRGFDFTGAAAQADRLSAPGRHYLPPNVLLDAVMAAYLGAGRPDVARAAYQALVATSGRDAFGVRNLYLGALVGAP